MRTYSMNILFRTNASRNGFVPEILDRLHSDGLVDKCVVVFQGSDKYDESYCHAIDAYYGYHDEYDRICDMDSLPAVSGSIWERLLVYKDNTLNMMCRHFNMHIMYYDEMEEEYVRHVMFWNDILDRYDIGLCFFAITPHTPWEYVIYSLAKVKGIPTLIEEGCNIHGLSRIGTSVENLGANTNAVIRDKEVYDYSDCSFSPEVSKFYNNIKDSGLVVKTSVRDDKSRFVKKWVRDLFIKPSRLRPGDFVTAMKYVYRKKPDKAKQHISRKINNTKRLRQKINSGKGVRYYDSFAAEPDYDEKYVYYAFHYEPEGNTLPAGGVFNDQFLAVKMLADALDGYGIKLYVKENWLQLSRRKYYYDRLKATPNIRLINTEADMAELIRHAVAVSSITGTCLYEAIIHHVPAMGFTVRDMEYAPGFYFVKDTEDIKQAIDDIISGGCRIDEDRITDYFKAFTFTHIPSYLDYREVKSEEQFKRAQEATCDLIKSFITSGMKSDFVYTIDPER